MSKISAPLPVHPESSQIGVLITNLGTPAAPTKTAVRRYLAEFLADPRVVEIPRPLWWLILYGLILPIRSSKSAALYQKVWTPEGSPLLVISQRQAQALQQALQHQVGDKIHVVLGMRYGQPSLAAALEQFHRLQIKRILVLPLYPQYSAATTASTFDAIAEVLKTWRWLPELRLINQYAANPAYIKALADSIRAHWQQQAHREHLLFSFHGLPQQFVKKGDPYYQQCQTTAALVAESLQLSATQWTLSFQSRLGRAEWLRPYTDEILKSLPGKGITDVAVICPGFAADCLETLEEIDQQNRELFLHAGGKTFHYIPALNDSEVHITMLSELVLRHIQGW